MTEDALTDRLAFYLLKKVNKACREHALIQDGDRIAVAISGGKDSLTLLDLLLRRRSSASESYDLIPIHVGAGLVTADPHQADSARLAVEEMGLECTLVDMDLSTRDRQEELSCFRCSWNRRKTLFLTAEKLRCNKVAFGHHADDIAHTVLMNLFHHGSLDTMQPLTEFFGGALTVIRPLAYVPEKEIVRFAKARGFSLDTTSCPQAERSARARMVAILRQVEDDCPNAKTYLRKAARRWQERLRSE
jgi:tRNA 2-thiocytidine biosynthesis protein TtcA